MKTKMINFDTNTCKLLVCVITINGSANKITFYFPFRTVTSRSIRIAFERGSRTQKKKASSSEGGLI